jgi:hypothetical protein
MAFTQNLNEDSVISENIKKTWGAATPPYLWQGVPPKSLIKSDPPGNLPR